MIPIESQTPAEKAANIWSVSSRAADALTVAQARFGPRDAGFTLLGYKFEGAIPLLGIDFGQKQLQLILAEYCAQDLNQAIYQLSHEVVHMLAPTGAGRPTYLEEGLATLFSEQYTYHATGLNYQPGLASYTQARDAVACFMVDNCVMRNLRLLQPTFADVTPAQIKQVNPQCAADVAELLCSTFQR